MQNTPVKLAILWHMHQPNYQEPDSRRMVMPWVRLHALKDYLDMPLMAARFENVKTTFNLVPSLLDQLECYLAGGTDPHLELSRFNAETLTEPQKSDILVSFFSANPPTMIKPYRRYLELYRKVRGGQGQPILPALFSSEEIRDLQVWSNLCWVDPSFHHEEPIRSLLNKKRHFTEAEKHSLLDWEIQLIKRIIPTYQDLLEQGKIDISFTPYYHPILPLLCDTQVATEAMPRITLPKRRFMHPEDARQQVRSSMERFESLFGRKLKGMWPSEGSVSEAAAAIMAEEGIEWIATDEEIRFCSLKKSGLPVEEHSPPLVYEFGQGLKIFFRDHALSDRIGFVYSGWDADKAAIDFVDQILAIRSKHVDNLDQIVVPIILDGENAWEYFPNDGNDFLEELYRRLGQEPLIEMLSMSEAASQIKTKPLPSLFAGSWINHNFRIWIGHPEDNAAWDLLASTRDRLAQFESENHDYDREKILKAWKQIYIAEGSDWCWWYGDEHRGSHNEQFDQIFRRHLMAVYELLGLEIPFELLSPIYRGEVSYESMVPDSLITPSITGRVTHFYEWTGAGIYDCRKAGNAMHRVDRLVSKLFFGFDHDWLYIRLDFVNKKVLESIKSPRFVILFDKPDRVEIEIEAGKPGVGQEENDILHALDEICEIAVRRTVATPDGFGAVEFTVSVGDGERRLETVPADRSIRFELPEANKELFWPV